LILWIFPGQPLQYAQPEKTGDDLLAIDQLCRDRCGYDLLSRQPLPGHVVSSHSCLQLHGVAMSLYQARILRREGLAPQLVAEHSLGLYAALTACGCIGEGDALELAGRFGACMSGMGEHRQYALGCPTGLTCDKVETIARNNGVYVANYNTSRHFLLAGSQTGIEAALDECRSAGAFSVSCFPCEAPLHTPLMEEIGCKLEEIVKDFTISQPQIPLVEHIGQTRLTRDVIAEFLVQELCRPVYWEKTWLYLRSTGFSRCMEVGSGQALSKLNRWIESEQTPS